VLDVVLMLNDMSILHGNLKLLEIIIIKKNNNQN
jgi:hypothetical protein